MAKRIAKLGDAEQKILARLEKFARLHDLELFNVKGSLFDRVRTLANNGGVCPCFPDRPHCPCPQCIHECKEKGECGCRLFVAPK